MDIFIIEDDQSLSNEIKLALSKWGYSVGQVNDFENITNEVLDGNPKLILMDINLPSYDGFYWCSQIRNFMKVPIIFISSRDNDMDIIMSINMGGDDYITKPFSPKELVARVKAILKRNKKETSKYVFDTLIVDDLAHSVTVDNKKINLTPKEYELLKYLIENKNIALTREQLLTNIWGYDFYGDDRTIDTHIKTLRNSLGKYRNLITTVRSVGYKFEYHE